MRNLQVAAAGNFYEALTAAAGLDRDTALHKTWNLTVTCREGFLIKRAFERYISMQASITALWRSTQWEGGLILLQHSIDCLHEGNAP
jgi:hypothetical protein